MSKLKEAGIKSKLSSALSVLEDFEETAAQEIILCMLKHMTPEYFRYSAPGESHWRVNLHCKDLPQLTHERFEKTEAYQAFEKELKESNCTIQSGANPPFTYLIIPGYEDKKTASS